MEFVSVSEKLASLGLAVPDLNALVPNEDNYQVLLLQPLGDVEADNDGVRNRDRELANKQFGNFITKAFNCKADLVVTPEYSMPWDTLTRFVKDGKIPEQGKLWALGCESIKLSELNKLKLEMETFADLVYENFDDNIDKFVSPLVYLFIAKKPDENDPPRPIMLVQFKTHPMGDLDHFEVNRMHQGKHVYLFGGNDGLLRLVSLICSDVFEFQTPHAIEIYDRTLILHIQLNPKPLHVNFCGCRQQILDFDGDATEILCLNWAENVCMSCEGHTTPWKNVSCSAWYLKPATFDFRDETLNANHQRGLYYTWFKPLKTHALFFNYSPAVFLLDATKVARIGVRRPVARRRGPQLKEVSIWNEINEGWEEQDGLVDGFAEALQESGNAKNDLLEIFQNSPIAVERVIALCAGKIDSGIDWYKVCNLDTCVIDASENIKRLTFCQDKGTETFRNSLLRRCGRLWDIITTDQRLPPALADFREGVKLSWISGSPHQNSISYKGNRATVIYMGEDASYSKVENTAKIALECLHKGFSDLDESHNAKQRLAVWYRDMNDEICLFVDNRLTRIDNPGDISEFDIGREE